MKRDMEMSELPYPIERKISRWLNKATLFFLVFLGGAAFGYGWHFIATGGF